MENNTQLIEYNVSIMRIRNYKCKKKSKITKILNSEENSKQKVRNQNEMAKSEGQTHQTTGNNRHIPDLVQAFSYPEKYTSQTYFKSTYSI